MTVLAMPRSPAADDPARRIAALVAKHVIREWRIERLLGSGSDAPRMPPHDLAAERAVVAWLVAGHDVPGVDVRDYWIELHGVIDSLARTAIQHREVPSYDYLVRHLAGVGFPGQNVADAVRDIMDYEPLRAHPELAARRISELARRRRALDAVAKFDAMARCLASEESEVIALAEQIPLTLRGVNAK